MAETIHEKNLAMFAKKIGITVKSGWKTALAKKLKQKRINNISSWVKRGVPTDFHHILENAGIDPEIWWEIVEGPWIQGVFYRNIQRIIDDFCGGIGAVFDEKIGSPYAGIRWKTERPSNDAIAAVVMQFGVNRHWLLTGEGEMLISSPPPHDQQKQPPPPLLLNEYPYSIHTKSIHDFVEEVLTSTDENAINALKYGMVHTRRPGAFACGRGQHRKGNE